MKLFNKNKDKKIEKRLKEYPACDHLNNALNSLLNELLNIKDTNGHIRNAIEEICWAIKKSDGYFYDFIKPTLESEGFGKFFK